MGAEEQALFEQLTPAEKLDYLHKKEMEAIAKERNKIMKDADHAYEAHMGFGNPFV